MERLDAGTRAALSLTTVHLQARDVLHEPGMPTLHVYFPLSGVISLVSTMQNGAAAEVALIGREGMVGLEGVLGTADNPTTAIVQISGTALRAAIAVLKAARLQSPHVRSVIDRYTQARLIQVAQTAACNALHPIDARLARWLLAVDDRIDGQPFTLPQEFMAQMLGVQRPTVSTAMQKLLESKAVTQRGRAIVVADRSRLEPLACECHGVLRREFDRLRSPVVDGHDVPSPTTVASSKSAERASQATIETMRQIAGRLLVANIREQEARDEADASSLAKDHFLAMVSHDLRAPLNVILGWCANLKTGNHGSVEHGLDVIQRNATAQLRLVEDLLDAVRLASSTLTIRPAAVNLGEIVRHAVDAAQPMADEKQVTLRLSVVDAVSPLMADRDRLRQVFVNVVTNAVQFTDAGGSVDVAVSSADRHAHVTVQDTGRGIAPDLLPHVFERFRQGRALEPGSHGLGLGLSIAHALVELHGGRIQMASPGEGLGTTCTIDFPLKPA
ncbi:MAG TPA: ATP-binding protein [Vicinamibacterales bacterium]|nr:ATP-binding protein [Vicinamibacterales bacterium]